MNKNEYEHSRPLDVHRWFVFECYLGTFWSTIWSTLQALITKYACTSIGYNDWNTSNGAAEKTRTSTGYSPTATSTLRVYQFRHSRILIFCYHMI